MSLDVFLSEWNNDSDCMLVHTSGSTGSPKALWVEKRRMVASARMTCSFLGLHEGDVALLCLPLDYIAGKMMVVRAETCRLRLLSVEPTSRPMQHIGTEHIHFAAMVPLQVWNTLQVDEERERLMQIDHLIIGGGPVDGKLQAALSTFPNAVWSTYGMTETLSHIALRRLNGSSQSDYYSPFEGVGVSLNGEGCLVIDAPAVCAEPLTTNDCALLAPDGRRFRILGRRDNVVCSGGIKLQIEEIEQKLRCRISKPFMITKQRDCALGEALVLLVEDEDTETYKSICNECLSRYEQPRAIYCVAHLPLTPTGKPARHQAEMLVSRILCH